MTQSWSYTGAPPTVDVRALAQTLVEGSTFCLGTATGDIPTGGSHGLFFRDLRCLSRWELRVDGHPLEPVAAERHEPHAATYACRVPPRAGRADSHLLVLRHRYLGDGMREDVVIRNLGQETAGCTVTLLLEADFADLFAVKENRVVTHPDRITTLATADSGGIHYSYRWLGRSRDVHVTADAAPAHGPGLISFSVAVPPRGEWRTCLQVTFAIDGFAIDAAHPCGQPPELARPAQRGREWADRGPLIASAHPCLANAIHTGQRDLGALRIHDPEHPDCDVVAAGAPWFMTVFGRDSLLSAWMALPVDSDLTLGTLQTLARFQGSAEDPLTEEQPGRILHEMRFGVEAGLALGGGNIYYGSADATPLFVALLGEAHDWGLPAEHVMALLPHADACLDWIARYGDRDGDGFVEYRRATDRGLVNQGWKDSGDGINFANGQIPSAPIALCEVQAYVYAAYAARSRIAADTGDSVGAERWQHEADLLKRAFNEKFWLPDRGYYAVALDRDKRPVDALTSNIGHCLWTGIVDDDKSASVAQHLLSPDMFSGWGIRTLASSMGAYNPLSYHNGSVWPHDNAIAVAGLMRYGHVEEAQRVTLALLDAVAAFDFRMPELWCGFDRSEFGAPLPYPTSCSPQAWAAATPVFLLRSLLGLRVRLPDHQLVISPSLPSELLPLSVDRWSMGSTRVRIDVDETGSRVTGLPGWSISSTPRVADEHL
ncbi:MAG TPA: glycogen debranching N-terminal domain-containing protein [Mycobacteriales bacterium]|nr:glycogen debranching N-terminal domain-containing protein [Mycobacteriales bacterium]